MSSKGKIPQDIRASTSLRRDRSKKRRRSSNPFESETKEAAKTSRSSKKLEDSKDHDMPINDSIGHLMNIILRFFITVEQVSEVWASMHCNAYPPVIMSSFPYVGNTYEVKQRFIFAVRLLWIGLTTYDLIMNNLESASDAVCELILR
ncbi:hypothetical protein J437_LFUL012641 [Ladona fulva]|uniref:Uncharacterized protein n=1 Tax=Ladona fulva TaxID=123851 RepID=A0A8K0KDQ3_LADFU|nr:hypothetical protein J437_LFUL012641 [Ladona fulva]